jgi:hypothetical protein
MFCTLVTLTIGHWYHKCPLLLSSPDDLCVCVKQKNVFVQNEVGNLENWLKLDKSYIVQKVYPTSVSSDYICKDMKIGAAFRVMRNGSWFCKENELTLVQDEEACYG